MSFARNRGYLGNHWRVWESWGADRWVVEVLRFSYRVLFLVTPPLSNVPIPLPSYSPSSIRELALSAAVADLRAKGAIEPAPPSPGFYSRLFVTPKVTGGWQPVIDLSRLNCSVRVSHFYMETQQSVFQSASWGLSLYLRDAYLQVPVHPESRCYLRFCVGEEVFQRSLLRPFDSFASVHSRHGPDFVGYAPPWVPVLEVPRRLASPLVLVPGTCTGEGLSPLAMPGVQCPGQPGEELSDSYSDLGLPGDAASDASFEGFPDPQTCPEACISRLRFRLLSSAAAGSLASAVRGDVVDRSGASVSDAVSSAASELRRPSSSGFGERFLGCLLPRGSLVVVRRVSSSHWPSAGSLSSQPFTLHGRLRFRLGGLPRRLPPVRLVVSPLFAIFDQPPPV